MTDWSVTVLPSSMGVSSDARNLWSLGKGTGSIAQREPRDDLSVGSFRCLTMAAF